MGLPVVGVSRFPLGVRPEGSRTGCTWTFRSVRPCLTFAPDGNRFYATLASKGKTYLIDGDYARYRGKALRENVECPSLSPGGTRIAFKKKD